MPFRIFHNPRCSKSRAALALLTDAGVDIDVVRYLDTPPDAATIESLLAALDTPPATLVRAKEARQLDIATQLDGADIATIAELLAAHPAAIERPIVVAPDGRAMLGRPPERIKELL
ncbi:MAG: ArsC/Spx/MgsR family protein [Pseudomonadota bacterium]